MILSWSSLVSLTIHDQSKLPIGIAKQVMSMASTNMCSVSYEISGSYVMSISIAEGIENIKGYARLYARLLRGDSTSKRLDKTIRVC